MILEDGDSLPSGLTAPPRLVQVEGEWYVHTSGLSGGIHKLTLKDDLAFTVLDEWGDLPLGVRGEFGYYWRDTRHLSGLELRLCSDRPLLLAALPSADGVETVSQLVAQDLALPGGERIPRLTLFLLRRTTLVRDVLHQAVRLACFHSDPFVVRVELHVAADFAHLFEVRGARREERGESLAPTYADGRLVLAYRGLDGVTRRTFIDVDPVPSSVEGTVLAWDLALDPRRETEMSFAARASLDEAAPRARLAYEPALADARSRFSLKREHLPRFASSDDAFTETLERAASDVATLLTRTEHGWYPTAGIPWYATPFGRDGLWTAWFCLPWAPSVAREVLRYLASRQADHSDDFTDAEPGKILHELREGEMANLREIPFVPYYGSADATPLFVCLAAETWRVTGDSGILDELWPAVRAAVAWIERSLEETGFTRYRTRSPMGLRNQGWKDSYDSIHHADGTLAEVPIALAEVQGYVYRALLDASEMSLVRHEPDTSVRLRERAERLQERVERVFWDERRRLYAQALDRDGQRCDVRASHLGHLLWSGIVAPRRAEAVCGHLCGEGLLTKFGIRTLAADERRYNPLSYHNGSIWPHDNAIAAEGMRRYRRTGEVQRVTEAVVRAVMEFPERRAPELFCGFDGPRPVHYPVACSPQAWAAASVLSLLGSCIGITVSGGLSTITFNDPWLPPSLDWLEVRGLPVGESSRIDVVLRRGRFHTGVEVLDKRGEVQVVLRQ